MNEPLDLLTLAHSFTGLVFGKIRIYRWLCYSIAIGWEIFQLYFTYAPRGLGLNDFWLDSVVDILACIICYEIIIRYWP